MMLKTVALLVLAIGEAVEDPSGCQSVEMEEITDRIANLTAKNDESARGVDKDCAKTFSTQSEGVGRIVKYFKEVHCWRKETEGIVDGLVGYARTLRPKLKKTSLIKWLAWDSMKDIVASDKTPAAYLPKKDLDATEKTKLKMMWKYIMCASETNGPKFLSESPKCGAIIASVHTSPTPGNNWFLLDPCADKEECQEGLVLAITPGIQITPEDAITMATRLPKNTTNMGEVPEGFYNNADAIVKALENHYASDQGIANALKGKKITVVGYSGGAGTGAIVTRLLQDKLSLACDAAAGNTVVTGVFFGPPPVFDKTETKKCEASFTSVITADDIVPFLTIQSVLRASAAANQEIHSSLARLTNLPEVIRNAARRVKNEVKSLWKKLKALFKKANHTRSLTECDTDEDLDDSRFLPGKLVVISNGVWQVATRNRDVNIQLGNHVIRGAMAHPLPKYAMAISNEKIYYCSTPEFWTDQKKKWCADRGLENPRSMAWNEMKNIGKRIKDTWKKIFGSRNGGK